jgi:hypothetical protein
MENLNQCNRMLKVNVNLMCVDLKVSLLEFEVKKGKIVPVLN